MSTEDLALAADWAAAEGWNPGVDDVSAFHAVDPEGFLMGWIGDEPVAAISVVRHSRDFGFLGFYLCRPEFRGAGHGLAIWEAGIRHLGDRTIGLDGVVAQQDNYRKSGFAYAHNTQRWEGSVSGHAHAEFRLATDADLPALVILDEDIQGVRREAYASGWFTNTSTRLTLLGSVAGRITAVGTIRACREGHKIGPLIAPDAETARAMVESLAAAADANRIALDVPDSNTPGVELARSLGLVSSFACARMYRGQPPGRDLARIFGETTFELG